MTKATDAFERLQFAMFTTDPACKDDDRFISDDVPAATLAPICRTCPVYDLCAAYGELDRPKAGTWAGKRYKTNTKKGN
ncbi:WhiB family transcriptional regulator [Cryobacterium sp. 10I5]|uniref:WhiB family transcriptional regulator n=1 Tax=Cryobacterium sp. 10I5 TaxID=3048581 RepID=UPI002B22CA6E|nr:WhiB family transcriptional regulator [Cryobacterium sp. 10I5]MEB0265901.1 WhiB family transcriptional regulator [Cryobacterium sp. 10I5]